MNILVTGATGFVGGALVKRLSRETGVMVRAAGRASKATFEAPVQMVCVGDLSAVTGWSAALPGIDVVVHLAARVHVMNEQSADPSEEYRRTNVDGTEVLARAAAEHGVRRMVFVSTAKVNGDRKSGRPFTERKSTRLNSSHLGISY